MNLKVDLGKQNQMGLRFLHFKKFCLCHGWTFKRSGWRTLGWSWQELLCLTGNSEASAIAQPPFDFFSSTVTSSLSRVKTAITTHWLLYMSFSSHFLHSSEKNISRTAPRYLLLLFPLSNVESQDSAREHMLNEERTASYWVHLLSLGLCQAHTVTVIYSYLRRLPQPYSTTES